MPTTGIGHSGAQAIVPDRLAALKANAPSPRVYGQPGLTFADADQNGEDTRADSNRVRDICAWADA